MCGLGESLALSDHTEAILAEISAPTGPSGCSARRGCCLCQSPMDDTEGDDIGMGDTATWPTGGSLYAGLGKAEKANGRWERASTVVGSLFHKFQIEEMNGNQWNVSGH
jgi:hypothetical protein